MSLLGDKLSFMQEHISVNDIYTSTGLTKKMQQEIIEDVYVPGSPVSTWINRLYQSTSYDAMRESGFSKSQAFRFNSQTPQEVNSKINEVSSLIKSLTDTALVSSLAMQGIEYDSKDWDTEFRNQYDNMYESVYEGFLNSRRTYEQWEEY